MGSIGTPELIVILVIALVIFGPGKLPEVGKAIGKGINEFKDALSGPKKAVDETKEAVKSATTIDVTAGGQKMMKNIRKLMIRRYYYVQRLRLW